MHMHSNEILHWEFWMFAFSQASDLIANAILCCDDGQQYNLQHPMSHTVVRSNNHHYSVVLSMLSVHMY